MWCGVVFLGREVQLHHTRRHNETLKWAKWTAQKKIKEIFKRVGTKSFGQTLKFKLLLPKAIDKTKKTPPPLIVQQPDFSFTDQAQIVYVVIILHSIHST